MYYDITRTLLDRVGLVTVVTDNGEQLSAYSGEGKELASVHIAYDSPEDNTIRRLGLVDFTQKAHNEACHHHAPVDRAFMQAPHYVVDDGQGSCDSVLGIFPVKYLVDEDVILYADTEGYVTPFAVDRSRDEHPVDVFNQHALASGILNEGESYQKVEK